VNLILPDKVYAGAGGALTYKATPYQAVYWSLVGINLGTGEEEDAHGSLKWAHTKADQNGFAINYYFLPAGDYTGHTDKVVVSFATGS
jgi:hypothetical protein